MSHQEELKHSFWSKWMVWANKENFWSLARLTFHGNLTLQLDEDLKEEFTFHCQIMSQDTTCSKSCSKTLQIL
jgi:hypothetical protein